MMKRILKYLFGTLAILLFTIQDVCAMQKKEWHDDYYTNRLTKNADFIIVATSKGVVKLNKTDNTFYNASYEYLIDEECRITAILAQGNDTLYYSDGYYGPRLFDGNTTKNYYSPINESGDNYSYSLALDSSNDIWINFRGRFSKPTEFNIFPINQPYIIHDAIYGAPTAVIMDMAFDSKGTLWMATYGLTTQVVCLQNQQNSPIDVISGEEKQATSIIVDFDDNIWVTSDDGIHCYNQETSTDNIITHTTYPQVPNEQFLANDIDSQGNIWFSSSTTLMKYDGEEFTTYTCPDYNEARSILCDGNIVWVLLKNDTLLKFESNEFETIDLSPAVTGIEEIPRGIDLGEYAFGIPISELSLHENVCNFTLSFWMNPKEFIQTSGGTLFVNIRYVNDMWPLCDWGYFWSVINHLHSEFDLRTEFSKPDWLNIDKELLTFNTSEWKYFTFVFSDVNDSYTNMALYVNGSYLGAIEGNYSISLKGNELIMIGGSNFSSFPLNAYVDKVQFYNKALSQTEVEESMMTPLLNDESLLGFWDFEDGCTTDADGYMISENGTIKATMYKILELEEDPYYYRTIGAEIKPFVFGEGVDPESVIQGVEESTTEVNKSKAFVTNEMLNIENAEGINSVVVYDAMGKVITSANANGATSTQIALPSTIKGLLIVKVNSEVIKVICN